MLQRAVGRVGCSVGARSLSRRARLAHTKVAVVSPLDNPALKDLPADVEAEFLIGHDLQDLLSNESIHEAEALLWIPPGSPAVLKELVRDGHLPNLKWAHGFYAGVDVIADFARTELAAAHVPLSNGRGAFSSSLAEYALSSTLHFVKQVPRCMENRRAKKWDKFVMVRAPL